MAAVMQEIHKTSQNTRDQNTTLSTANPKLTETLNPKLSFPFSFPFSPYNPNMTLILPQDVLGYHSIPKLNTTHLL